MVCSMFGVENIYTNKEEKLAKENVLMNMQAVRSYKFQKKSLNLWAKLVNLIAAEFTISPLIALL